VSTGDEEFWSVRETPTTPMEVTYLCIACPVEAQAANIGKLGRPT
jgi:hypothetical protein